MRLLLISRMRQHGATHIWRNSSRVLGFGTHPILCSSPRKAGWYHSCIART